MNADAKPANPASLSLDRLAELRRAPDAGGWESRFEVLGLVGAASPGSPKGVIDPAVAGIAHAKDAKGVIFNFGFLMFP